MELNLTKANELLKKADRALRETTPPRKEEKLRCGLDLGTASVIMVVLGENDEPLACEMQACQVARDGLVVDYMGAIAVARRLKEKLESRLGRTLVNTAIAVPPGTNIRDSGTHRHVAEAAGLEVTAVLDEPTAACSVLGMTDGVVVDVGGGTTGLAVFEDGKAVYTADEPTGGTHISLVLMGGIQVNNKLQPLNTDNEPIEGLYIAGNTQGGRYLVEYPITVAGISLATALTFGRMAGLNATGKDLEA